MRRILRNPFVCLAIGLGSAGVVTMVVCYVHWNELDGHLLVGEPPLWRAFLFGSFLAFAPVLLIAALFLFLIVRGLWNAFR